MATSSATLSATFTAAATITSPSKKKMSPNAVQSVTGLNSFGGLKAHNRLTSLGQPITTQQSFANLVMSVRGRNRRGGATCSVAGEIFQIAAIMNGLTLVGVAVGFVLLRIEAFVEENEAES